MASLAAVLACTDRERLDRLSAPYHQRNRAMSATSFSCRDAVILAGGIVAGTLLLYSIYQGDQSKPPTARFLGSGPVLWEVLLMDGVAGGACAGPVVLLAQWTQGRRGRLRVGEWLWLCPLFLYLLAVAGSRLLAELPDAFLFIWFAAWVLLQGLASLTALAAAFRSNLSWTDRFGCVTCFSVGAMIFINLILHPLSI